MATKIFWKQTEREAVADKAFQLIRDGEEQSWNAALLAAQGLVIHDVSRRRSKTSLGGQSQVELKALALERYAAVQRQKADNMPESAHAVSATELPQAEATETVNTSEMWMHLYARRIAHHFEIELTKELFKAIDSSMKAAERQFHQHVKNAQGHSSKAVVIKPRVLICSMKANQENEIKEDFDDIFELSFFKSDENLQQLKPRTKVDHIIIMAGKSSHAIQNIVRGHPSLHMVSGGVSMIKDKLLKIACM